MKKYLKVGFAAMVLCGLVAGRVYASADSLDIGGTVTAIHKVGINNTGYVSMTDLAGSSYSGASGKVGQLLIDDNNPSGFAVRFYSKNYASGIADTNGAVLRLTQASTNYPSAITTSNMVSTYPGAYQPYSLDFKLNGGTAGSSAANTKVNTTALSSSYSSINMKLKNTSTAVASDSNEIRFNSPTQATVAQTIDISMVSAANTALFAGTYRDTVEVLLLDFDSTGADQTTLYNEVGSSDTF